MTCWSQLSGRHHSSEQPEHQRSKPSPVLLLPRPKLTTPAHSLPAKGAGVAYFGPAGPGSQGASVGDFSGLASHAVPSSLH